MRHAPAAAGLRGVFRRRSSAAGLRGFGVLPRSQKNARSAKPHPPLRLSHPHFVPFLRMERHFSPLHPQFAPFLRMERRRLASCPALPAPAGFSRTVGACLMISGIMCNFRSINRISWVTSMFVYVVANVSVRGRTLLSFKTIRSVLTV